MNQEQQNNLARQLTRLDYTEGLLNPYKQFAFVVPDGGLYTVDYNFNYFRILSISNPVGVTTRFGSSGTPTDIVGAGLGFELPNIVKSVQFDNKSGGDITVIVALAIGRIDDDRFTITGALSVATPSTFEAVDDATLGAATADLILAANANRKEVILSNDTGADIRIGDSTVSATKGYKMLSGATMIISTSAAIYGYSVGGGDISISYTGV